MRPMRRLLLAAALLGLAGTIQAAPAMPKDGVEYRTLPAAQRTDAGDKVEVIEFFAYYCPHCNAFEPLLAEWVRKQGTQIVFKRVHVPRDAGVLPQQRLFYTLAAMGLLERYHDTVFAAMHRERLRLNTDELVFAWAAGAGIDRARFVDTYRSAAVQEQVQRANASMRAYQVDHWPLVAIDGRFLTSAALANDAITAERNETQQHQAALQVMDYLVAKAKADQR
jgi:thiol:disulfide interchange protein DsbA